MIILECMIPYYGNDCSNMCSAFCNVTGRCDKITGRCGGGVNRDGQETLVIRR